MSLRPVESGQLILGPLPWVHLPPLTRDLKKLTLFSWNRYFFTLMLCLSPISPLPKGWSTPSVSYLSFSMFIYFFLSLPISPCSFQKQKKQTKTLTLTISGVCHTEGEVLGSKQVLLLTWEPLIQTFSRSPAQPMSYVSNTVRYCSFVSSNLLDETVPFN